ncbi:MAG: DUF126 domain-containing protein [Candidatus Bathyarchaeia archaeon]
MLPSRSRFNGWQLRFICTGKNGLAPKAIINHKADPVIVVGAVIANIPTVNQIDVSQIKNGDIDEIDAYSGVVKILRVMEG